MSDRIDTKETTMTTKQYNTEDFANAEFARHPDGSLAVRAAYMSDRPWRATTGLWLSDADMADHGWVPAHVSRNPQKMRRHISDLEAIVKRRGEDIARLEEQRAELTQELAAERERTITLDALRDAWETAEVADECNEGDVLIYRHPSSLFDRVEVWGSGLTGPMDYHTRILHRAPKRPEGAEAIEEALLKEWLFDGSDEAVADLADRLARRGVLVVEGGK